MLTLPQLAPRSRLVCRLSQFALAIGIGWVVIVVVLATFFDRSRESTLVVANGIVRAPTVADTSAVGSSVSFITIELSPAPPKNVGRLSRASSVSISWFSSEGRSLEVPGQLVRSGDDQGQHRTIVLAIKADRFMAPAEKTAVTVRSSFTTTTLRDVIIRSFQSLLVR